MTVKLSKGGDISLSKEASKNGRRLSRVTVGCGWRANRRRNRLFPWFFREYDIDLSAVGLNASGKAPTQKDPMDPQYQLWLIYPNHRYSSGAIRFMGDNRTGSSGKSDDEQIKVDLGALPPYIRSVVFQAVIWRGRRRLQTFGRIKHAYIRICDQYGQELARYNLDSGFRNRTLVVFGELYREGDEWKFRAIGRGYTVAAFRRKYGVGARFHIEFARYAN